jgi:oligopeptide transport system permease protein
MYFLRRILLAIPLLLVISTLAFALVHLAPGSPFDRERKPASPEIERNIRAKYHADEPLWQQYGHYLGDLLHGDFGVSLKYRNHTVNDIIRQGLPVSMLLGALAFAYAMVAGIAVGFWTAARRGRWPDHLGSFLSALAVCLPSFVVAPVLVLVFSLKLKWFPLALWTSPWHMVLPPLALGTYFAGRVARIMREGMLTAAQAEFVVAARAKGLGEAELLFKHVLRLALLPVVSYAGPMLADLLVGSFVIENIFQIPGIGVFLVNSSLNRDYTMVVGLSLLYAVLIIGLNLAVDLAYKLLDPRVKYD